MSKLLVERLTPAQEALIPVVRDEWLGVGLCTAPADRERAAAGVRLAYEAAGLAAPRITVWLGSPLAGAYGIVCLQQLLQGLAKRGQVWDQVWGQVRGQVGDQVGDQVWGQVWDQVWGQVRGQVGGQVRGQVRDQVWGQVGGQVRGQVGGQVRGQVRDQVWGQVRGQVRGQVGYSLWGQHDVGWLSFYDYFRRATPEVAGPERLQGLAEVARAAGWWWALRGAVLLTERPNLLARDEQFRLHSVTGPAIRYPDGFAIWSHHGVRVPREVIEDPASLGAKRISTEANAEVRRVMIERYTPERYLREAGAKQLHTDDWGTLWRADLSSDEPLVMVEVRNSTPEPDGSFKDYWLRVPPTVKTAREAVAWTFDMPESDYQPAVMS